MKTMLPPIALFLAVLSSATFLTIRPANAHKASGSRDCLKNGAMIRCVSRASLPTPLPPNPTGRLPKKEKATVRRDCFKRNGAMVRCASEASQPSQPSQPSPPSPVPPASSGRPPKKEKATVGRPTKAPVRRPTRAPVRRPTRAPRTRRPTRKPVQKPTRAPTRQPTRLPTSAPVRPVDLQVIPSTCQVDNLITLMDMAVELNKAIAPQWLRLAFHDAGTFNVQVPEGGANGCLLTDDVMRSQPENHSLDLALDTLRFIEGRMINATVDSIRLSSADLIQFAGFFVAVRQRGTPGLDFRKRRELRTNFQWGRLDEANCQARWTENLPGFELNAEATNIPQRCRFAGREIRVKMMDRNGFTAREATALIGAHTIGLTRNVFGPDLAGPWVENGADDATPQGPVFDNGYHMFLIDSIPASTVGEFEATQFPFDQTFPTWFRANVTDLNYLDTDIVLGFPSQSTLAHPHFDTFSREFAGSNTEFIDSFMAALDKMSKLGVEIPLLPASSTSSSCGAPLPKANAPLPKEDSPSTSPVSAPILLLPSTFAPTTKPETFTSGLLASIVDAGVALLNETLVERKDEIAFLTTPVVLNSTGADVNTTGP